MYKIINGLRLIIGFRNQTRLMFINDSKTVETNESLDTFFKDIKIVLREKYQLISDVTRWMIINVTMKIVYRYIIGKYKLLLFMRLLKKYYYHYYHHHHHLFIYLFIYLFNIIQYQKEAKSIIKKDTSFVQKHFMITDLLVTMEKNRAHF